MELSATEQREVPDPRAATHLETGNTAICNLCLSSTFLLPSCQLLILSQHSQEQRPTSSNAALGTSWSSHKHIGGTSVEPCLCAHTALFTSPKHAAGSAVTHLHLHLQDTSHFQVPSGVCEEGKALGNGCSGSLQPGPSTVFLCAAEPHCLGMEAESEAGSGR